MKEFTESFEFFSRTRTLIRGTRNQVSNGNNGNSGSNVADLACGHGLTGILFAVFEKSVERVWLVDRKKTKSLSAVFQVGAIVLYSC
jgi:hypothetical protein